MKFKTKLYLSIGSLLLLIFISVIILMNTLQQSTVTMNVVVNDLYERIKMASLVKYETANIGRVLKEIVSNTVETKQDALNAWEESHTNLKVALETLENEGMHDKSQELIAKYKTLHESYQNMSQQIITNKQINHDFQVTPAMWAEAELTRNRMNQIGELLYSLQEQQLKNELIRSRDTYKWIVKVIYLYLALGLSLGIGYTIWIIRKMTANLNNVTTVMKTATDSDFDTIPRIEINQKDEMGKIAITFNKMAIALEEHSRVEKQLKEEAENNSWIKSRIAEVATMYPEVENIENWSKQIINKLVPMVEGSFGVFYLKETEDICESFKMISAYAYSVERTELERFQLGEGLIGQCAAEKRTFLLNQLPDDFVKIRSGMGGGSPKSIVIIPVQFEEDVLAVIEIASFKEFSKTHIRLLEEINGTIGMTINSILNRMKAERLLHESQALTEELQVQSEELQLQQEELRTTNEKLEEQYFNSEQKKKEVEKIREALEEKAQQLEASSQYKSEFLANMSHELRTPLNSLLILAQILTENGEGNLTNKQLEYIRTIYSSGHDLLQLINDILDLAKVESGKLEIVMKEVELKRIQENLIKQFSPVASQKEIEFHIDLHSELPPYIYTDEHRIEQILKNLLSNAFKFTESGSVTLLVRNVIEEIDDVSSRDYMLAFSVIDTGIGIPKEKQEAIFEAFKQADGTTSRHYGGTGLGLSISRKIAHLLGGQIDVNSIKGGGSTFTLYLPYDLRMKADYVNKEVAAGIDNDIYPLGLNEIETLKKGNDHSQLKGKNILVVDDDIRNIYALTVALEQYELNIYIAENGREGIAVLQENPDIDLILMDIMMPEMDGFEAMRRIRSTVEFKEIPIIALTAKAMKHSREECLQAGATDYISKPINVDQLISLIHVWLYSKEG